MHLPIAAHLALLGQPGHGLKPVDFLPAGLVIGFLYIMAVLLSF
jgi:hypothetical protein